MKKIILSIVVAFVTLPAIAQRYYEPHFDIGVKGGMTMSSMEFSPTVSQSMVEGATAGIVVRYVEEKIFGLVAELNVRQCGWKEKYDPKKGEGDFHYSRRLTYIDLPIMTHIYFGNNRIKGFVNLGPSVGYYIGEKISADFDYKNPSEVEGYPLKNRRLNQMSMPVKNKFEYGITGGAGMEVIIKNRHSLMLEARYYFGLGSIFPSTKKDEFSASRGTSIMVSLGYMFRVK